MAEDTSTIVFVEYWYKERFMKLKRKILNHVKNVAVEGKVGRPGSFEVIVQSEQIFSKLETGRFPKNEAIVEEVLRASRGEEPRKVESYEKICSIS